MDTAVFYAFIVTVSLLSIGCIFAIYAILKRICEMILVIKELKKIEKHTRSVDRINAEKGKANACNKN